MSALQATGLREIAAALTMLDAKLDDVANLRPGWDGHGSPPVDPAVIRAVRAWGRTMPGWLLAPAPSVVPLSSGGLQLEWHDGPRVLELEFEGPATIHYLKWEPDAGVEDEDTFPASDRGRSEELIGWVRGGAADG